MDKLIDMIISDESPSSVSDQIKDVLYTKASERVDALKPSAANSVFVNGEELETKE